jgi:WD40 repeat protein
LAMEKTLKGLSIALVLILTFLAYLGTRGGVSWAGEPTQEPILRIETGMHTAAISRIATDPENHYLVSCSDDKTVRLWELPGARLVRTLRPPIGIGHEGKIYAVALSPDGKTIACGGLAQAYEHFAVIYLFDRESGRLIKRISGLPRAIHHLTYSKDGSCLVATLGGDNGIRVYRTSDYSQTAEDKSYGDSCFGADFDQQGRLVTVSFDGFIRLYDRTFKLINKAKTKKMERPFSVSFSPDGTKIAVGLKFSLHDIQVLSARDLSLLYTPDTTGTGKDINNVAWSSDGRFLYAGGEYSDYGSSIRKWSEEGKGSSKDLNTDATDTIMHILPLKKGGIIFASAQPSFGIIDNQDQKIMFKGPLKMDYRGAGQDFLISHDGTTVQFANISDNSPVRFSIPDRFFDVTSSPLIKKGSQGLQPSITTADGIDISNWKNNLSPKLNGSSLSIDPYEPSRSLAISPNREYFLLGTEWYLRLFDLLGREKWKVPAPDTVWCVNISGNGQVATAAFGDGTIRWYRLKDGKELLALFPNKDKRRWILWSPKGYYDTSPGGEEIIGWHVNYGKDQAADFFPASRFRNIYYQPEIIGKEIQASDQTEVLKETAYKEKPKEKELPVALILPPVVEILSPKDGSEVSSTEIQVKFTIRAPSGESITQVRVLVDGRPVAGERRVWKLSPQVSEIKELPVPIPARDVEVSVIAENKFAASEPATVRLKWKGEGKEGEFVARPKLYLLSVGVSRYNDSNIALQFPSKDAKDFAQIMMVQKGTLYQEVKSKVLTDKEATKEQILDGLDWLSKEVTSKDVAMIFFAGHGVNDAVGEYFFLTVNTDTERLKRTALPWFEIKKTASALAGKVIVFVDTCHSGNVMGTRRGVADMTSIVNELASAENGVVVFASSTGKQYSLEDPAWRNGAFTKALVEGLKGKADMKATGRITINMLDYYVSERVKELTKGRQTPTTQKPQTIPDFPVAVIR